MADRTLIEWSDATWNIVTGCTLLSEGCRNCYAAVLAAGRLRNHPSRIGLARRNAAGEARFTGEVRFNGQWLEQPLRWRRPRKIFVCAHGDLFHESVPDSWIDEVFAVMALASHHTFQVLTKRPARARAYLNSGASLMRVRMLAAERADDDARQITFPLPNVWLGTSAEDQVTARERVPELLNTMAAVRFLSAEPLLGPLRLDQLEIDPVSRNWWNALTGYGYSRQRLDQVIVGGESGPGARPMHPAWPRALQRQCERAGTAFFFKQWGSWYPAIEEPAADPLLIYEAEQRTPGGRWLNINGAAMCMHQPVRMIPMKKSAAGRELDGRTWEQMPRCAA